MPLFERQLFANRQVVMGLIAGIFVSAALAGFRFMIPLVLQSNAVGFTALQTGLALLPYTSATFLFSWLSPSLSLRFAPKYIIQFGLTLILVGIIALDQGTDAQINIWAMLPGIFIIGMGKGIASPQLSDCTLSAIPKKQSGMGAGLEQLSKGIGLALGTALLGSLLISACYANFVDLVEQQDHSVFTPVQKEKITKNIQGAFQTMTPIQEQHFIAHLPLKDPHTFEFECGHCHCTGDTNYLCRSFCNGSNWTIVY